MNTWHTENFPQQEESDLQVTSSARRILSDPNLKDSNHSAGIFSFVDARGNDKRSSMRGSQLRAGPRAFSRSGKRGTSSSSWAGWSPNFRQEIRQSHYRNDPVKYDLNLQVPSLRT